MKSVFEYLHENEVSHGDFGPASMYHMLSDEPKILLKRIEQRALAIFIDEMNSLVR